jgi:hypothetical protein
MNDVVLYTENGTIKDTDIFNAIDATINQLKETGDISQVKIAVKTLLKLQKISGLSLAKLLYELYEWWQSFENKGNDDFYDWIISDVSIELNRHTVDRYILVWQMHVQDVFPEQIKNRPIKEQIAIAKHLQNGYPITDWDELEMADNYADVGRILRKMKGVEPKKGSIQIYLERDGSLYVWSNDFSAFIGYLDIKNESEQVQKAINRILDHSGVIRR